MKSKGVWPSRHPITTAFLSASAVLVIGLILSLSGSNQNGTTAHTTDSSIPAHLSLAQLAKQVGHGPTLIETTGKITKKFTVSTNPGLADFFVISEGGAHVLVDVNDSSNVGDPRLYQNFNIGTYVNVIGGFGSYNCSLSNQLGDKAATKVCQAVGANSSSIPAIVINKAAVPAFENRLAIEKEASATQQSRSIQNSGVTSESSGSTTTTPLPNWGPNAMPISTAIKNYSSTTASNVDVVGIVTSMDPERPGFLASWGNTLIVTDGVYSAAVHNVSNADFNNISAGDTVEITGGYMQDPEKSATGGLVVPIVNLGGSAPITVKVVSPVNL